MRVTRRTAEEEIVLTLSTSEYADLRLAIERSTGVMEALAYQKECMALDDNAGEKLTSSVSPLGSLLRGVLNRFITADFRVRN